MLITSRDLLRIEYQIGYDCIVGVIPEYDGFSLRVKTFDDISGEDIFFQRTFTTANLRINKTVIFDRFAVEAQYTLNQFINNLQKQKVEELI